MAEMVKRKKFLDGEVLDLSEQIALTSPTDTPLSTLILGRGAVVPAKDITVTWRERKLNEDNGTLKLEGAEAGEVITSTTVVFFPVILIGMVVGGLIYIAFPLLIIGGIIALISSNS